MLDLNRAVYHNETLVGWFTDLPQIDMDTAMFHQFFSSKESGFTGKPPVFTSPLLVLIDSFSDKGIFNLNVR